MNSKTPVLQPLKEWLTPLDLQDLYNLKLSTQNKLRMSKKIPYSKFGKKIFYSRAKINQLFDDAKVV